MIKVGIAGVGFVGGALKILFEKNPDIKLFPYDKYKKIGKPEDLNDCNFIFLCLPTLLDWETRDFDLSAIDEVLSNLKHKPLVILKSTVTPGTTARLSHRFNRPIIFNPEFLTERNAIGDMLAAGHIILGGDSKLCEKVADLYQKVYHHNVHYLVTDFKTAELVKLVRNAFLSTKVNFFNCIYSLTKELDINYYELRELILQDWRIGHTHTLITEEKGFGGHCLPKDLNALIAFAGKKMKGKMLKIVWNDNCKFRKEFKRKEIK